MRKIAIANQKGGVGKTTTAINLSAALAERDRKVLLIDLDPQGHATEGLGLASAYDAEISIADYLVGRVKAPLSEIILDAEDFYLIPSNISLFAAEQELSGMKRREFMLSNLMDRVDYDYVLVDCPPNLGVLVDNALIATREIIIPIQAEDTSLRALGLLFDQLNAIERSFGIKIKILGILPNIVLYDGVSKQTLDSLKGKLPLTPFQIKKRVEIKRAWRDGKSILKYNPKLDMADNYRRLADLVDQGGVK
ncbi:MAG: protochlorophyllide reductase iron-sulfur ATP-binding protein [Candidatus Methanolliviera sp. GoM_asphalt]|jgi:chromosome partitioning protein|nr:MAG: protochlorophyllide reductase iron-sulfur ATP-binding protein [Candidatus Methanolliviera sp. GoM_asphalt]